MILQTILIFGLLGSIWEQQWLNAVLTAGIITLTLYPVFLKHQFQVRIPAEFQLLTIVFVFAAVFLGEIHDYYGRFWWWDLLLHTTSGLLLGVIGFLLVYVLNESEKIDLQLRPGFVALFAFLFALGVGTLWEIFEFAMDTLFGLNMQKTMFSDTTGLTDTMWDLMVDAIGALMMSLLGYGYLNKSSSNGFLARFIQRFIRINPGLFHRRKNNK
ncbi:putative membrane protein [Methylophaga frappieri]|uniref:Putative membrane protein n=1 Tax=Methylophaga frappieri (strain ATCC BAA-2434 / DSM 25690 / JAM7) TaxID=754477 RepID=I1YFY1_METFJ|nr:putative membrane protein [Methylophaga frappieri]